MEDLECAKPRSREARDRGMQEPRVARNLGETGRKRKVDEHKSGKGQTLLGNAIFRAASPRCQGEMLLRGG